MDMPAESPKEKMSRCLVEGLDRSRRQAGGIWIGRSIVSARLDLETHPRMMVVSFVILPMV